MLAGGVHMLMCLPCSARRRVRKLKQVGKTQKENSFFRRRYRCLGCGATLVLSGTLSKPKHVVESWKFPGIDRVAEGDSNRDLLSTIVGQIPPAKQAVWR
jgi:transposase-like protein